MKGLIPRFRIFPAVGTHKDVPRPIHQGPEPRGTPAQSDSPPQTNSIEVGGDTKPPGPSGLRDGFES